MGGGIYVGTQAEGPNFSHCVITGNRATNGGGMYCVNSGPDFDTCAFTANSAGAGGGLYWSSLVSGQPAPIFRNCNINGNSADSGGGAYCYSEQSGGLVPTFANCTISGNWAQSWGGGVGCQHAAPILKNCVINGNKADQEGGGVSLRSYSSPQFMHCTVCNDSANLGGGAYCAGSSQASFINTIIAFSEGAGIHFDDGADNVQVIHCNLFGNSGGEVAGNVPDGVGEDHIDTVNANGDPCDSFFNIFFDPLFADPEGDFHLTLCSHSIGAAADCVSAPDSDIEGTGRPSPEGTLPDIGAYEDTIRSNSLPAVEDLAIWFDGDTTVILKWQSIEGIDGYEVSRCDSAFGNYEVIDTVGTAPWQGEGLVGCSRRFYRVTSVCLEDLQVPLRKRTHLTFRRK
ncbi:MAG: right-handed parallel beta-helix repeat-containing protein [bacterium]